ncbi:MAG: hypothetical protein H6923_05765 [Alphaproteobacteria bacterium]|nr:hypothetical protein [Alphaproteobacteria bacterium]
MDLDIAFSPLLPLPLIAAAVGVAALVAVLGLARRGRGALWRLAASLLIAVALVEPSLIAEEREPLHDVAVLVVDRSPSQRVTGRLEETDKAAAALREKLAAFDDLDLREISVGGGADGTQIFAALSAELSDLAPDRIAGVVVVTDGEIHDVPDTKAALGFEAPVHTVLAGNPDEEDRRLVVEEAPRFGLVGDMVEVAVRVDELGPGAAGTGEAVRVVARLDGEEVYGRRVGLGERTRLFFRLAHPGASIIEIEAEAGPHELTLRNNRAIVTVNGVRDRLKVLLVSGEPYQGERTWRNLLKSDPAVDLVHFTILRPPNKFDGTPEDELALINFPKEELFTERLHEFDLIIFDRYRLREVLDYATFDNIAGYVEKGGALLVTAGPAFASRDSLYRTPLERVLPARPTGRILEKGYRPALTDVGRRHPVTAVLARDGEEGWGRWFRLVEVESDTGESLMTGADGKPLLVLACIGEGRVAELMSDQAWLWARGFEGGGPQAELMRRLAHWLMKEPDLDEESLSLVAGPDGLTVSRRTLSDAAPAVTLTGPDGKTSEVTLAPSGPGAFTAEVEADEPGIYKATQGTLSAVAALGDAGGPEFDDVRATDTLMKALAAETGGGIEWLSKRGVPDLRRVGEARAAAGTGWLGLRRTGSYTVRSAKSVPLLPLAAFLALALVATVAGWRREAK